MNKKQKRVLKRIIISAALTLIFSLIPSKGPLRFCLFLIPYLIIGYDILKKAFWGIRNKQVFDENFLMATATIGAIIIAVSTSGDYLEAIAVMLFYQIGELFQSIAVGKSRKNITELMDIRPDYANIEKDGELLRVDPEEISIGSTIIVRPGEKIPIDGIITKGSSSVNMSALTGESLPKDVFEDSEVLSGSINLSGEIKIKTTKEFGDSTASKILDMVENASSLKSRTEAFISRFAKIYTPLVCIGALLLAVLPPVISLIFTKNADFTVWVYRALTFLVVSCPCALVISVPLTFFAGIGGMSREGILVKGSNYIEALAKADCVVFDKTGTLTQGTFDVTEILCENIDEKTLLDMAAHAEIASSHPIAESLKKACGALTRQRVSDVGEISGKGIIATVDGKKVAVGNLKLMEELNISCNESEKAGTAVYVAIENEYMGLIVISDTVKATSKAAVSRLKKLGIRKTVMLTGDNEKTAKKVSEELSLSKHFSSLLPGDKVLKVEELLNEQKNGASLLFVGDGINDAPVLARADVGVAMGMLGSDSAIEAADVVLMDDDPLKIASAISFSKKCIAIVRQNCVFAIGIKLLCLALTAFGITNMWLAIFADVGVMVIAVLNAVRALKL